MTMSTRIKEKRTALKMTQEELASKLGLQKSAIAKYENGRVTNIKRTTIQKMAEIFDCSPSWLMGLDDESISELYNRYPSISPIETQTLPVLGRVACGEPIFMAEERDSYVKLGVKVKADFCLIAAGDSMTGARINDGDVVFIRKDTDIDDGDIYAVAIDDEVTLKRLYQDKEHGIVTLMPANPKYKPMIYSETDGRRLQILGKAVAFQGDL